MAVFLCSASVPVAHGENTLSLPKAGAMMHLSPAFRPATLMGIKVDPKNALKFDFLIDKGDENASSLEIKNEADRLIRYFMAALTVPEKDVWVNLSPYEKDRIVPEILGQTAMGRDLLAQDYILKQITASLIYPDNQLGRTFWKRVYEETVKRFGRSSEPINTFNKVWIMPDEASVYENPITFSAYVTNTRLKVMLEEDYLALNKNKTQSKTNRTSQIIREVILPELTREINSGKNFAMLRQIYNSLILSAWYKKKLKISLLGQVYADKNKVAGIQIKDLNEKNKIYAQYLLAFKKGVFNFIKEEKDPVTQRDVPRKYFSGGFSFFNLDQAMSIEPIKENLVDKENIIQVGVILNPTDAAMNASTKKWLRKAAIGSALVTAIGMGGAFLWNEVQEAREQREKWEVHFKDSYKMQLPRTQITSLDENGSAILKVLVAEGIVIDNGEENLSLPDNLINSHQIRNILGSDIGNKVLPVLRKARIERLLLSFHKKATRDTMIEQALSVQELMTYPYDSKIETAVLRWLESYIPYSTHAPVFLGRIRFDNIKIEDPRLIVAVRDKLLSLSGKEEVQGALTALIPAIPGSNSDVVKYSIGQFYKNRKFIIFSSDMKKSGFDPDQFVKIMLGLRWAERTLNGLVVSGNFSKQEIMDAFGEDYEKALKLIAQRGEGDDGRLLSEFLLGYLKTHSFQQLMSEEAVKNLIDLFEKERAQGRVWGGMTEVAANTLAIIAGGENGWIALRDVFNSPFQRKQIYQILGYAGQKEYIQRLASQGSDKPEIQDLLQLVKDAHGFNIYGLLRFNTSTLKALIKTRKEISAKIWDNEHRRGREALSAGQEVSIAVYGGDDVNGAFVDDGAIEQLVERQETGWHVAYYEVGDDPKSLEEPMIDAKRAGNKISDILLGGHGANRAFPRAKLLGIGTALEGKEILKRLLEERIIIDLGNGNVILNSDITLEKMQVLHHIAGAYVEVVKKILDDAYIIRFGPKFTAVAGEILKVSYNIKGHTVSLKDVSSPRLSVFFISCEAAGGINTTREVLNAAGFDPLSTSVWGATWSYVKEKLTFEPNGRIKGIEYYFKTTPILSRRADLLFQGIGYAVAGIKDDKFRNKTDAALISNPGGIDLDINKLNLNILNSNGEIVFNLDPAKLEQLKNVSGWTPVITSIHPLKELKIFFGNN